jgi:hypothetical protein
MLTATTFLCVAIVAARPATMTVDEIAAGMARLDERFNANAHPYQVEYEKSARYFGLFDNGKPRGVVSRVTHARKGQKIFVHFKNNDDADTINKNEEVWFAWDGKICGRKTGETIDYYSYLNPVLLNYFEYFRDIDVDTYKHIDAPYSEDSPIPSSQVFSEKQFDAQPRMLKENRSRYTLRPEQEQVDGAWCHVLEWPGFDVIWVDTNRSCITLRREYRVRGLLRSLRLNKDLKRFSNGLWLPTLTEQTTYVLPGMPPGRLKPGDVAYDQRIKLIGAKFDNVNDDVFKLPIRPDETLLVHDSIRHMSYVRHPAGTDPLDAALKEVETHTNWETWKSDRNRLLFIVNACLVNLVLALSLVRWIAKDRSTVPA